MKNSNIIIEITKKASQLYSTYKSKGRVFWQDAMRQAAKLLQGIKEKSITFWKINPNADGDFEPTTRNIATLESIGYHAKTQSKPNGLIKLVDVDKYLLGEDNFIISFFPFQIV